MFHADRVTLFCFFSSYFVALGFEAAQLIKQNHACHWLSIGFSAAGLVAHTLYLLVRSRAADLPPLLSSTHDWLLVLAWLIVLLCLFVELLDSRIALALFVLPVVLLMLAVSRFVSAAPEPSLSHWRGPGMFHASMLVLGMAGVLVGFVISLMYLVQHRRLKHKRAEPEGLHLLSLEMLGRINWWAVVLSVPLLTVGLGVGVWLAVLSADSDAPVTLGRWEIVASGVVWLAMAALFVWMLAVRRPSGRLVAWRTLWACGFLSATLMILQVVSSGGVHGVR